MPVSPPAALVGSAAHPWRLLVVNGNTTETLTEALRSQAQAYFGEAARIRAVSARFGPAYIASRAEAAVAAHAVLETVDAEIAAAPQPYEACLIACFGEPGIDAVRERHAAMPVAGMAEAAVLGALQLGERYAIVTVGARWPGMLRDYLRRLGLASRCAGVHALPGQALEYATHEPRAVAEVGKGLERAAAEGADVIIVAGAALAGCVELLPALPPVPVVDSYRMALGQLAALAALGRERAAVGRNARA
ncbi:aspartate/glutamate racemase family protein [Bordetella sp. 2513F-2]